MVCGCKRNQVSFHSHHDPEPFSFAQETIRSDSSNFYGTEYKTTERNMSILQKLK